jgi:hypothetical protein
LYYNNTNIAMTPFQFSTALALRLDMTPPHLELRPARCACGSTLDHKHILLCDQATGCTHATRHNRVRDTIITHARRYAITCSAEPALYSYHDGKKHRPDILFHSGSLGIVTDITIVAPKENPGDSSEQADTEKTKIHTKATSTIGHTFIPCAFEMHGHLGNGYFRLIQKLAELIPPVQRTEFKRELTHAVSTVMAVNRAEAIQSAIFRHRWA